MLSKEVERESPPAQTEGVAAKHSAESTPGPALEGRKGPRCWPGSHSLRLVWMLCDRRKLLVSTWLHAFPLGGFYIYVAPVAEHASVEVQKFSGHRSNHTFFFFFFYI